MLTKLLKYDLKWIYKLVTIFYIAALISAVIGRLLTDIDNSLLLNIVGEIISGFAIGMIISSLINCIMKSWVRFIRNIYKDESYLTHTLPVTKKTIYSSKIIASIICTFTTVVVAVITLFILYYSKENLAALKNILEIAATTYDTTVIVLLLIISLILFLEILFILIIGYVGIIIGHRSNKSKIFKSLIAGSVLYVATTSFSILFVYLVGLFNPDLMNMINTTSMISIDTIKLVMIGGIGLYLIYNIVYYYVGLWQFKKGVNVE